MKHAPSNLSLWSIIESMQRRLERAGLSAGEIDRAVEMAVRTVVARPGRA